MKAGELADLDPQVLSLVRSGRRAGKTWAAVAVTLDEAGLKTSTGRAWTMQTARLAAVDRKLFIPRHLDAGLTV